MLVLTQLVCGRPKGYSSLSSLGYVLELSGENKLFNRTGHEQQLYAIASWFEAGLLKRLVLTNESWVQPSQYFIKLHSTHKDSDKCCTFSNYTRIKQNSS
jgi:hypothetical protein